MIEDFSVTLSASVSDMAGLSGVSSRLEGIATGAVQEMAHTAADSMLSSGASSVEVGLSHMTSEITVGSMPSGRGRNCWWERKPGTYPEKVHGGGKKGTHPKALGTSHGPFFSVRHPYPKRWVCDDYDELEASMAEVSVTVAMGVDP